MKYTINCNVFVSAILTVLKNNIYYDRAFISIALSLICMYKYILC